MENGTSPHTVYLSTELWAELEKISTLAHTDVSSLISETIKEYLKSPYLLNLKERRTKWETDFELGKHTIHIETIIWKEIKRFAKSEPISISLLLEVLLRRRYSLPIPQQWTL